jgi:signal transduction histidine kinase
MKQHVEIGNQAIEELGRLRQEVTHLRAMSARQVAAEARLSRLANFPEQNPDILVETNFNGQVTYMNPVAQARFPDLARAGFRHPLFLGMAEVLVMMRVEGMAYSSDEISLGEATFERQVCHVREADNERVRIYLHDITRRKQAEKAIQTLARQVVYGQEEERRRLSRELHDEAGQALTALKLSLELLRADLPVDAGDLHRHLAQAIDLAETTMDRVRHLAHGLRPPALDTLGLDLTLGAYCRDIAQRSHLTVDYRSDQVSGLSDAMNICLYRVLQEALTNVVKHARARRVRVDLGFEGEAVRLEVADDGCGLAPDNTVQSFGGIGMLGMRERLELLGGRLEVSSVAGQGLRLWAILPLQVVA